jgi:hypothetical protein
VVRNLLFLVAVAGCSHTVPAPAVANRATADPPTLVTTVPVTPAADECPDVEVEDQPPGNVDRYGFDAGAGHWGYKDSKGTVVIAPMLRWGYEFKKTGIAAAIDLDGTFVFIDKHGKRLAVAFAADNGPDYFAEGFARIVGPNKKVGFISDRGVIPAELAPQFDRAGIFCHGKAQVVVGAKLYEIDRAGTKKELGPAPPPEDPCGEF